MGVTRFVHAGVVVEDLEVVVDFLTAVGLECGRPMTVEGEWVDRIVGLEDVRVEVVMARAPDGTDVFELARFHTPRADAEPRPAPANRPGLRHVCLSVDDLRATVERVRAAGWGTVGEIVDYEGVYLLCYLRGPEGLIVELAQPLRAGAT